MAVIPTCPVEVKRRTFPALMIIAHSVTKKWPRAAVAHDESGKSFHLKLAKLVGSVSFKKIHFHLFLEIIQVDAFLISLIFYVSAVKIVIWQIIKPGFRVIDSQL